MSGNSINNGGSGKDGSINNGKDNKYHLTAEQIDYEERRKQRSREALLRKNAIELRRQTVFSLSSQGLSQIEIGKRLNHPQSLISSDLAALRAQFREALRHHIENELGLIYNQTMHGMNQVIKCAFAIHDTAGVPENIRLHALHLIADCQQRKLDMATSGYIIEQGIEYVENMRAHMTSMVRAIPQDEVRDILHEEITSSQTQSGDDDSFRMDESSGVDGGDSSSSADGGAAEICSKGINNSAVSSSPTLSPAATSSTDSNTFEEVEDQSNEDLSLTDPDSSTNSVTADSSSDDSDSSDDEEEEEDPTANMIF